MKKKLTLWAALCMVFVCFMSMTAAAAGTATISQCIISGGNQISRGGKRCAERGREPLSVRDEALSERDHRKI